MAGFYGADVDQLRDLAAQFGRAASSLDSIAREVNTQATVATRWEGPDSVTFRGDWNGAGRASMTAAAEALRSASDRLRENAREQNDASADTGGTGGAANGLPRLAPGSATILPSLIPGDLFPTVQLGGLIRDLWESGSAGLGPFTDRWSLPSPEWIHDQIGHIGDFWHIETPVFGMDYGDFIAHLPGAGDIGKIIGISDIAFDPAISIGDKAVELGSMVTMKIGDELMDKGAALLAKGGTPATWLVGLNVKIWTDVIKEASHSDLSLTGLTSTGSYAWTHPGETIDVVAHAGIETLARVTDYVGVGFLGDIVRDSAVGADFSPAQVAETGNYALQHPDVVVQEVGKAVLQVGGDIGNEVGKFVVNTVIDNIKFW